MSWNGPSGVWGWGRATIAHGWVWKLFLTCFVLHLSFDFPSLHFVPSQCTLGSLHLWRPLFLNFSIPPCQYPTQTNYQHFCLLFTTLPPPSSADVINGSSLSSQSWVTFFVLFLRVNTARNCNVQWYRLHWRTTKRLRLFKHDDLALACLPLTCRGEFTSHGGTYMPQLVGSLIFLFTRLFLPLDSLQATNPNFNSAGMLIAVSQG